MRTRIGASITVGGDPASIRRLLRDEFLRAPKAMTIELPVDGLPIPGTLALSKEITITARLLEYSANMPDDLEIEFVATRAARLFPVFRGKLEVSSGEIAGQSVVEITGSYTPPLGVLGMAIDTMFGYRIAQRCVANLLKDVAAEAAVLGAR